VIGWTVGLGVLSWWLDHRGRRAMPAALQVDAVVVAGCAVWPGGVPSPALQRRVDLAARLYFAGVADTVVVTGGVGREGVSEAEVGARALVAAGVPRAAVRLEDQSTNTEANAREAARVLPSARSVVVTTDRWHVARCTRSFERHFERVVVLGTDRAPRRKQLRATVREALNVVRHRARGTW